MLIIKRMLLLYITLLQHFFVYARDIYHEWTVEEMSIAPDNFQINSITINKQFPGPTIEASTNDHLTILVHNKLHRPISIHWHGIVQKHTPHSDGVPNVTQNAIQPGTSYTYDFTLHDQSGTFWYHAHTGMDGEQLFGAFIIRDDPNIWQDVVNYDRRYDYDDERVILLSELWHRSPEAIVTGLTSLPYKLVGIPDSILINGMDFHKWNNASNNVEGVPFNNWYNIVKVHPFKTYRFRVIGANGRSLLHFRIKGHTFTIIEADGTLIEPIRATHLEVNSGQRYSILVKTNKPVNNFAIITKIIGKAAREGRAIMSYEGIEVDKLRGAQFAALDEPKLPVNRWLEPEMKTSRWYRRGLSNHYYKVPKKIDHNIVLNITTTMVNKLLAFSINGNIHKPHPSPLLNEIDQAQFNNIPGTYEINYGHDVQIVFQQFTPRGFTCEQHPWHMHGHSFHIVGGGSGIYDPVKDNKAIKQNLMVNPYPLFRDTFTHFPNTVPNLVYNNLESSSQSNEVYNSEETPYQMRDDQEIRDDDLLMRTEANRLHGGFEKPVLLPSSSHKKNTHDELRRRDNRGVTDYSNQDSCGWMAIRFKANNPGAWLLHCHITAHLLQGKQVVLMERRRLYM